MNEEFSEGLCVHILFVAGKVASEESRWPTGDGTLHDRLFCKLGGREQARGSMRTPGVVAASPVFEDDAAFTQRVERLPFEAFGSKATVEAFGAAVLLAFFPQNQPQKGAIRALSAKSRLVDVLVGRFSAGRPAERSVDF